MEIKTLTSNLSISPQVLVSEIQAIAQAGFKAIVCNRPDGEGPDQPSFKEIEQAANQYGLQAKYLPVESGKVRDEEGQAFGQLLNTLPDPCWPTAELVCDPPPCGLCRKQAHYRCHTFWRLPKKRALT